LVGHFVLPSVLGAQVVLLVVISPAIGAALDSWNRSLDGRLQAALLVSQPFCGTEFVDDVPAGGACSVIEGVVAAVS
jgi:hypothetical protein